ncbi:hypothetical protein DJ94_4388 [Bacillus pseudomycoides]|nr:hypothetical protein DJ94_4388 [Bacillus pseudomycoides]
MNGKEREADPLFLFKLIVTYTLLDLLSIPDN